MLQSTDCLTLKVTASAVDLPGMPAANGHHAIVLRLAEMPLWRWI